MKPLDTDRVAAWVERTTTAQGVPARVTDAQTVEAVAVLLGEGREPVRVATPDQTDPHQTDCDPEPPD